MEKAMQGFPWFFHPWHITWAFCHDITGIPKCRPFWWVFPGFCPVKWVNKSIAWTLFKPKVNTSAGDVSLFLAWHQSKFWHTFFDTSVATWHFLCALHIALHQETWIVPLPTGTSHLNLTMYSVFPDRPKSLVYPSRWISFLKFHYTEPGTTLNWSSSLLFKTWDLFPTACSSLCPDLYPLVPHTFGRWQIWKSLPPVSQRIVLLNFLGLDRCPFVFDLFFPLALFTTFPEFTFHLDGLVLPRLHRLHICKLYKTFFLKVFLHKSFLSPLHPDQTVLSFWICLFAFSFPN